MFSLPILILFISSIQQQPLSVEINGLRNSKGHVLISLFRNSEGFPDKAEQAYRKERLNIIDKHASIQFPGVPPGTYAIAILHDENDDQKMNTNWVGLPKEGYGFSNNVMGSFGPPSFKRASFLHNSSQRITIAIRARY